MFSEFLFGFFIQPRVKLRVRERPIQCRIIYRIRCEICVYVLCLCVQVDFDNIFRWFNKNFGRNFRITILMFLFCYSGSKTATSIPAKERKLSKLVFWLFAHRSRFDCVTLNRTNSMVIIIDDCLDGAQKGTHFARMYICIYL